MKGGGAFAAIAFTVVVWMATVAAPLLATVTRAGGGQVPATFDGARVFWTTVSWAVGAAVLAAVPGWVAGRAIRSARAGTLVLAASLVAAMLPAYAVFWSWWQALGPGSAIGDWAAREHRSSELRVVLLCVGVVSWAWPMIAWCVAAQRDDGEDAERELHVVDAAGWRSALARAWRTDWPGLALGVGLAAFVVAGSTITFDLAQVNTFGFELRTLDVQGTPAGGILRAAWPAIAIAACGAALLACWPLRRATEMHAPARRTRGAWALGIVVVSTLLPAIVLVWSLVAQGALQTFADVALRGAAGTMFGAGAAGAVCAVVALGHMALSARTNTSDPRARAWRAVERVLLAGWLLTALVPGTVYALGLTLAFNRAGIGPWVYDTPAIVVLAHVGRYAAVAAWIGRLAARRESEERRMLRLSEGGVWNGMLQALAPQARAAALGGALTVAALGAGEVIVTARVEPPGWAWAAERLLNAIHYQQPDAVLGTLLALGALAVVAAVVLALGVRRFSALTHRGVAAWVVLLPGALLAAALAGGCRESAPPADAIPAVRSFGASGHGPGLFEYPRALEIDPRDGTVLVIDRQARVHRFDKNGRFQGGWRMPDYDAGRPTGFCVGQDGTVWIADTHYHRVMVYSPEGTEIRRWGEYGTEHSQFIYPCDVTIGPDGLVYVAEFGSNDRVQVFTPEGKFVRQIGEHGKKPGQFDRPQSIEFNPAGELLVLDACNHRIQVLDATGAVLRIMGKVGSEPGQFLYPYGLRALPDGTLLVAEFGGNRVQRLDGATGAPISAWHSVVGAPPPAAAFVTEGSGVRPIPSAGNVLRLPWAVAWREGEMYVLDSGHARVLVAPLALRPRT